MPRTKGSKNRITASTDFDAQIAKLEVKKATAEVRAAEAAKKVEVEAVLKKLLASGMTAEEILEKLK